MEKRKSKLIRIDDISHIDTSKISVYDLNNRYIDKKGDLYGLKYNMATKKIVIIKLMRADSKEARMMNQQIYQKKQVDHIKETETQEEVETNEDTAEHVDIDPHKLVIETLELMITHKKRFEGIMMNLKNSRVISKDNKSDSISLDDYFRTINIEAIQKIDKIESYQKELINYPRSITYYQSKVDKQAREIMAAMAGDSKKIMKFIYFYEMFHAYRNLYRQLKKILSGLQNFLSGIAQNNETALDKMSQQAYDDALISLDNTIEECEQILDDLTLLEKYMYDLQNY